jgi:hypothetical protein
MSEFAYENIHLQRKGQDIGYDVRVASTEAGSVQSDTLMALHASKAVSTLALPDDAIVVGARDIQTALNNAQALVDWIAAVPARSADLPPYARGRFFWLPQVSWTASAPPLTGALHPCSRNSFHRYPWMSTRSSFVPGTSGHQPA